MSTPPRTSVRRGAAAVFSVAAVLAAAGCARGPQSPAAVAAAFAGAFARHDVRAAADFTSYPERAATGLGAAWDNLHATGLTARIGDARVSGDTATVDYSYEWRLPKDRVWSYSGQLPLMRTGGRWQVRWSNVDIHPKLGDTQTMELRTEPAPRARVHEHEGTDVLVPGVVHHISFDPATVPDPGYVSRALAGALNRYDDTITADSVLTAARSGRFDVAGLSDSEFDDSGGALVGLPGVTVTSDWDLVPTVRGFATDLLNQVRKTVIDDVDGKAGWNVVTVNADGVDTDILQEVPPQPAPSFGLSIDRTVQDAAQKAVDGRTEQAMMVVIQPSTGALLAVAQNKAADADGPVATTGLYPPGSTFKTVTAAAAMEAGLDTPDTVLPCPGSIVVGERTIPNYDNFALGDVPMATAYARSCNTSFAQVAGGLKSDALTRAAAQFGVGPDYTLAGMQTVSGSVPPAGDLTLRTEDGIGQGKVVVSPFGMALVAATVARGSVPLPYLVTGRDTAVTGKAPNGPDAATVDGLRSMMRQVVTSGTAERIADQGDVHGKTGEAEVDGGSHAWFIGYRGDLAWATLVVRGGSSDNAVAVTRDMLAALPPAP
ncbi:penicillin-binding transpeptidase domain-containing protein [Nocardia stercoris]|uniref:Penicillin-binding transpeptidase domain-containing protein n=1 Tax=Nocardia stercoris TaxID=2483361 RepID=A0A3M2LE14_9NOCA|nr:penicillin-binding transpeptidase domain-containing protein [Nocardia stercoris]RMI35644.1 penicillin-binding transpeptidase domain-containing protein [Nocardia stercoris]